MGWEGRALEEGADNSSDICRQLLGALRLISLFFYPNEGIYRGNVFDADGNMIGDYSCADSVEIERRFPGIFGE